MIKRPLAEILKQETKVNHQELEKLLVKQIKLIQTKNEYIKLLQLFYSYFGGLEEKINEFIVPQNLEREHHFQRRKTKSIEKDLLVLGGSVAEKTVEKALPEMTNQLHAFGALYVIEGSTLGGRIIAKMMQRQLKTEAGEGFSFFYGYGDETESRWVSFKELLNTQATEISDKKQVVRAANDTFAKFKKWIQDNPVISLEEGY